MSKPSTHDEHLQQVLQQWQAAWPRALEVWSRFTRLQEPVWCLTDEAGKAEGAADLLAMIRLTDQRVVISIPGVIRHGLQNLALEVLAHEIGHHVLAPANLTNHATCIARIRWALPTVEAATAWVANLYTDLLINDRLQRQAGLGISNVYRSLQAAARNTGAQPREESAIWTLYMRIYEHLWALPRGTLTQQAIPEALEGDAILGSRLIRVYAREWLDGAGRFGALCLPYLLQDPAMQQVQHVYGRMLDTVNAGRGGAPEGMVEIDAAEVDGAIHPSQDPRISEIDAPARPAEGNGAAPGKAVPGAAAGQARDPFQYGEVLRATGANLSEMDVAVRYYKARAVPHLIKFPARETPETNEPLPEGLQPWDIGSPLEDADWFQSVLQSPRVVPGVTTVSRVMGTTQGHLPRQDPLHLDLYVDSSGSMPNPARNVSYLTLAGAIIALSALRAGARVQATLWSGRNQFMKTEGFVRDETAVLKILCGYYGGATQFPIHVLRNTFAKRRPTEPPAHVLIISDDGVTTLFEKDEKGTSGWDVSAMALKNARGGGSMVLNIHKGYVDAIAGQPAKTESALIRDLRQAKQQGWGINAVQSWEELVAFARAFSRQKYAGG